LRTKKTAGAEALWRQWPNKDNNRLFFGRASSKAQLSDFDQSLDEAISEFIDFVKQAGGLEKYLR
jgi:hypothetical protein